MLSSVANALRVLEFLVEKGEAGISEIARGLDFTVGTTYRLVATLAEADFVEQSAANRKYRPGSKIPELARRIGQAGGDFTSVAHNRLERLMEQSGQTVNLGVLRGDEVVYVDRAVTDQPMAVSVRIGSRVPAYCTSLGRALLAFSPEEVVEDYSGRLSELGADQPQPAPTAEGLRDILDAVRAEGVAYDDGEFADDIACIAAPILDSRGRVKAALSLSGLRSRVNERRDELAPMVRMAAKELSELLQAVGDDVNM